MPSKEGHLLVDGYKKEADIEYPCEHGEVINYTLDGVPNTPSHCKYIRVIPNSVAGVEGTCSEISP
jgi:hypothetical protein